MIQKSIFNHRNPEVINVLFILKMIHTALPTIRFCTNSDIKNGKNKFTVEIPLKK
jgi:hypothetical protein